MGASPTLCVALTALALALVACSAPSADPDADPREAPADTALPASASRSDEAPAPAFEPTFENRPVGSSPNGPSTTPANLDQCIDNGDPGGAENVATALPPTDDCDNELKTFSGTMKGAVDVDFYKLSATDQGVSFSHPLGCTKDTVFEAETAGTELCVFAHCKNSTVDAVTGCESGTPATSDIGRKGCCAAAPGKAVPKWDCSGLGDDDSAEFFLRVRQVNGDTCLPYTIKYRF